MKVSGGNPRVKAAPVITVRVEPNLQNTHVLWSVRADDGTHANGYARSAGDAMHDAAAFVEAMTQPRRGGMWTKQELRVVDKEAPL
jgi:hypothetical protein